MAELTDTLCLTELRNMYFLLTFIKVDLDNVRLSKQLNFYFFNPFFPYICASIHRIFFKIPFFFFFIACCTVFVVSDLLSKNQLL